jgi:hypothetical protein
MKLIMENWRTYQESHDHESEFQLFFEQHFCQLDEGLIDWAISKGKGLKDTVVNTIASMKDWTHEKIVQFVKFMGQKLIDLLKKLKLKGVIGKNKYRQEQKAIQLLLTNKHVDLAVMVFTTIAKLTGGYALDKLVEVPDIIEKMLNLLEDPVSALKSLLGDVDDVVDVVKKFLVYRKDKESLAAQLGNWQDFGGLAEEKK